MIAGILLIVGVPIVGFVALIYFVSQATQEDARAEVLRQEFARAMEEGRDPLVARDDLQAAMILAEMEEKNRRPPKSQKMRQKAPHLSVVKEEMPNPFEIDDSLPENEEW